MSIIFAAVSSAVNQLEVPVEAVMEKFNISRKKASVIVGGVLLLIGIPLDTDMNLFGKFADITSIFLIPLGAVLVLGFYFFFVEKEKVIEGINTGSEWHIGNITLNVGKYIFTPGIVIILILGFIYGSIG